jgi:hypothetical protein
VALQTQRADQALTGLLVSQTLVVQQQQGSTPQSVPQLLDQVCQ